MDAHLFRRLCDALVPLLTGSRVEKIREFAHQATAGGPSGLLAISLRAHGRKRCLCWRYGRTEPFCFLSDTPPGSGVTPDAATMRLRKHARGRTVAACVPQPFSRRLWLLLGARASAAAGPDSRTPDAGPVWLLLDMRHGASLHREQARDATGPQPDTAVAALVPPRPEYPAWPTAAGLPAALENWRDWPVLTPALRRCLAHLDAPEQLALLEDLRAGGGDVFLYAGPGGEISAASAWPLPPALRQGRPEEGGEEGGEDVLALLEKAGRHLVLARLAGAESARRTRPLTRRVRQIDALLKKLDAEETRLEAMRAMAADAALLRDNLWRWPPELRCASVRIPPAAAAGEWNGTIDAPPPPGRELALDPRHSVRDTMQRLFHTAKRGRRGLELLHARRAALEAERAALLSQCPDASPATPESAATAPGSAGAPMPDAPGGRRRAFIGRLPRNVQAFVSTDGFVLLRGRDARGNLAALRLAGPHDLWLHADNGPGAHVIVRRAYAGQEVPDTTLAQAASLAAAKSWLAQAGRGRVLCAEARHVRPLRGAAAGTVRVDKALPAIEAVVDQELESRLAPETPTSGT